MLQRFSLAALISFGLLFITIGCGRVAEIETKPVNPLTDPNIIVPDFLAEALAASGSVDAWVETEQIEADCVVTFYEPYVYLTKHHYVIQPWPASISISSNEPQGRCIWRLSKDGFEFCEASVAPDAPGLWMVDRCFAAAILAVVGAPVLLVDDNINLTRASEQVKIDGRWYQPILVDVRNEQGDIISRAIFYQNVDTRLFDTIWLAGPVCLHIAGENRVEQGGVDHKLAKMSEAEFLLVRGYDYRASRPGSVSVPTRIEIFKSDAAATVGQRLVKIVFYNILSRATSSSK